MRSDLASMAQSGGGLPRFESVKVASLAMEKKSAGNAPRTGGNKSVLIAVVAIVILAALGVLGYLAYTMFFGGSSANVPGTATSNGTTPTPAAATPLGSLGALTGNASGSGVQAPGEGGGASNSTTGGATGTGYFTHASLFIKQPADQVLTLALSSPGTGATSAADLATFNQRISTLLESAPAGKTAASTMFEIVVQDANDNDMSASDIFEAADANVIDPSVLADFNPDATFFAYHDANGFWPGYVIALKPNENSLSLRSEIAKLESSRSIPNFFLENPGAPSPDGFTDAEVGSTPVRVLPFLDATPPVYFVYGWSGNDLILSTSMDGFASAAARL